MNIIKCKPTMPDVSVVCAAGDGLVKHSEAYADLDGEPFKAYYHEACKPVTDECDEHPYQSESDCFKCINAADANLKAEEFDYHPGFRNNPFGLQ